MSDTTQLKTDLDEIKKAVRFVEYERRLLSRFEDPDMAKWLHTTIIAMSDQFGSLEKAANLAGVELRETTPGLDEHLQSLEEEFAEGKELEILDLFETRIEEVPKTLDRLSTPTIPEEIQVYLDQIIATIGTPLPEGIRKRTEALIAERANYKPPPPPAPNAADVLGWIQFKSKNIQTSTGRMQERWAKDFLAGNYGRRAQEMAAAKTAGTFAGYNNEGGASYIRIDQAMTHICWNWDRVGNELPDTTGDLTAEKLYSAYDSCTNEYRGFIERVARGLRQPGVANVVGKLFQTHLENHNGYHKTAVEKILAATKSLDAKKAAKLAKWIEETQSRLDDATKAAKGQ